MPRNSDYIPKWAYRPEILAYIIECYAGLERREALKGGPGHRVFIWESGTEILMGNTIAFAAHLREKFDLIARPISITGGIHSTLRGMGEEVKTGWTPVKTGDHVDKYVAPQPEVRVVGHVGDTPHPTEMEEDDVS